MIKLIVGNKGSGKTKQLIELVNAAAMEHSGSVICIERGNTLTYDIHYGARLINYSDYPLEGFSALKGFLYGCYASNYDLTHIFIDNLFKLAKCDDDGELEKFINELKEKSEKLKIDFTVTISRDVSALPESLKELI